MQKRLTWRVFIKTLICSFKVRKKKSDCRSKIEFFFFNWTYIDKIIKHFSNNLPLFLIVHKVQFKFKNFKSHVIK